MNRRFRTDLRARFHHIRKRIEERHIKRTTFALLLILPYLLLEWSARAFNLYVLWPYIDNLVHASFGIAFAAVSYLIYAKKGRFIVFWSFMVSVLWEAMEIFGDVYVPQTAVLKDVFFYDGIKDVIITFLSAVVAVLIIRRFVKRHYFRITVE